MLKTIKKCNNSRYETFKLVHVNDPLPAYYIKVNYDNDNNIDVNKIKKSHKFKTLKSSVKSVDDLEDVVVIEKNTDFSFFRS